MTLRPGVDVAVGVKHVFGIPNMMFFFASTFSNFGIPNMTSLQTYFRTNRSALVHPTEDGGGVAAPEGSRWSRWRTGWSPAARWSVCRTIPGGRGGQTGAGMEAGGGGWVRRRDSKLLGMDPNCRDGLQALHLTA